MSTQESQEVLARETIGGGGDGGQQTALAPVDGGNEGFFGRISKFWREVREETGRISWPSFDDVKNTTLITLAAVVFFAIYLFLADKGIVLLGSLGTWLLTQIGLA